jgi:hypothetical protein
MTLAMASCPDQMALKKETVKLPDEGDMGSSGASQYANNSPDQLLGSIADAADELDPK